MNTAPDDLQDWIRDWQQTTPGPRPAPETLARLVRRRSMQLRVWIIGEWVVGLVGLIAVSYLALTMRDPIERTAMAMLAAICVGALAFGWVNWRGAFDGVGASTTAYLDLSMRRLDRIRRALVAGWILLTAELAVMTPWIWYRRALLPAPAPVWPWVLLIVMCGSAAVGMVLAGRWLRRETVMVERLLAEHDDQR